LFSSYASRDFWECYGALPAEVQHQADKQFALFSADPNHPSLRLKPVGAFWSVRITKSCRALARRKGDAFYWFWIGTHADYERLLNLSR
jgi:hypothetical protein